MAMKLVLFLLCFISPLHRSLSAHGNENVIESVPDLEKSMYMVVDGYPCVRLLNLSGEIGCANPGREKVVAPVIRFRSGNDLVESATVLVSMSEIQTFFTRISNDLAFASKVVGVLVESGTEAENKLLGFSPAEKFPQAQFASYGSSKYEWNPTGSGIMRNAYNFPVFLISESSTSALQEVVVKNEKSKQTYTVDVAEFDMVMQTTKSGTRNSESCLREETCLPLGGYSVWSSLPPINISSTEPSKPIILAIASMDSASFFRDKSLGADSPISGLISLLAAVDALSRLDGLNSLSKQLVFLVCTGESWGYLGSRRFVHELDRQSDVVIGLNSTLIETVMEIGSVGKGSSKAGVTSFFAHIAGDSSARSEILSALKRVQNSLKSEKVDLSTASTSNPGIPPSSLMTFLKKESQSHTSGIVIEDFDSAYSNTFYQSHLDNLSNINSSSIVAAASLAARTLYTLAAANEKENELSKINVNVSLVEELLGCLLTCDPGLDCELVKKYISPSSKCPSHYVGVVLGEPSSIAPVYVDDTSRFVWNFLAHTTSVPNQVNGPVAVCSSSKDCNDSGQVCISAETGDRKGVCVTSTTRYVPAYSTRLNYESGKWNVLAANTSDPMGMVDPVWTESNWDSLQLRVYTADNSRLILLVGITITALSYFGIVITRNFINKSLKRD